MSSPGHLRTAALPAGVLAGSLSESEASRRVYLAAGGLALLGLVLLVGTVWWWRSTRNEHPSLAPLEVMGARRWRKASDPERQRLVEAVRPEGAHTGPTPIIPEPVDLAALAVGDHAGFDDLREIDELLGLDVDQLLALKPHLAGQVDDEALAEVDELATEAAAADDGDADGDEDEAADAADEDAGADVGDETVAIVDEADEAGGLGGADQIDDLGERDDLGARDDLDVAAELLPDEPAGEEPPDAPGDPLLERTAND